MMDNENYEELQESLVFYRTDYCRKVMRITAKKLKSEECDLMLNTKSCKPIKMNWKYNPKMNLDQIFEGEFGNTNKKKSKTMEGLNNEDSENLLKVTKIMKKMKYLKEVSEVDKTIKEIPVEVLLEKLQKQFGVQIS